MGKKSVAIIGAGLGGLSAAIFLKKFGFNVDVFEQSNCVGGKAKSIFINDFRFDSGPTLLTMPFVLENLFDFCGEKTSDFIRIEKLQTVCKYFYPDGTELKAYSDINKLAEELQSKTLDSTERIKQYFDYSKTIYDLTADMFLQKSFYEISTFLNLKSLKTLLSVNKIDAFRTMHQANTKFFKDEKTIQLFDRYATYNGSNPFKAPATLNIIQHVEYGIGGFLPNGGITEIPNALFNLAQKIGVNFFLNSGVEKILHKGNKINGVVVNQSGGKSEKEYQIVLSNSDVNFTYEKLLDDSTSKPAMNYKKHEPSTSALVFYWGIKGKEEKLDVHNILFSGNYRNEFEELFDKKICPNDPTVYIYISSKYNPSDAPNGFENWYVMINAPYIDNQNWEEETQRSRKNILSKIKSVLKINLSDRIVCEKILTPIEIEKSTNSFRGSLYGISSNSKFSAFLRQRNRSKTYKGLYFAGGSAHPGGGIPLVILSGKIAAELIRKYEKNYD